MHNCNYQAQYIDFIMQIWYHFFVLNRIHLFTIFYILFNLKSTF